MQLELHSAFEPALLSESDLVLESQLPSPLELELEVELECESLSESLSVSALECESPWVSLSELMWVWVSALESDSPDRLP